MLQRTLPHRSPCSTSRSGNNVLLKHVESSRTKPGRVARASSSSLSQANTLVIPSIAQMNVVTLDREDLRHKIDSLGTLGLRIGPSGLLFPYYIGVLSRLIELSVDPSQMTVSGCSGGALIGTLALSGLSCNEMLEANEAMYRTLLTEGTFQKVHNVLFRLLKDRLPADSHKLVAGRLGVQITQLDPFKGKLVQDFGSRADLIDAACTSCYIPFWSGPNLGLNYKGMLCCDGLTAGYFPPLPTTSVGVLDTVLKVCSVPNFLPEPADIGPGPGRYHDAHYFFSAIRSHPNQVNVYYEHGQEDVLKWASRL